MNLKILAFILLLSLIFSACKSSNINSNEQSFDADFTIAFGSCNKVNTPNVLWDDIIEVHPDVWIWGGDIIYADTEDIDKISAMYALQNNVPGYKELKKQVPVLGTWDDHDYGINDGGEEFSAKKGSQQALLNFLNVPANHSRRQQEGVYAAHDYELAGGKIKILILDTRYFRTALTPDTASGNRFKPNEYGEGTILGTTQWAWLEKQLTDSRADFNIIVSSIQFLSAEHGFETWGNFPHEVDRLKKILVDTQAKGGLILSGDRHISEFSQASIDGLPYDLLDFTSSGLTHAYTSFSGEPNPYRLGNVVAKESFGLVKINLKTKKIQMQIIANGGQLMGALERTF